MKTHVCPQHIVRMFKRGKASDADKRRACALASAWFKSLLSDVHPRDVIFMPDPDTGKLESWSRNNRPAIH